MRLPAFTYAVEHTIYGSPKAGERGKALRASGRYEPSGRVFLRSTDTDGWEQLHDSFGEWLPPLVFEAVPAPAVLDTGRELARFIVDPDSEEFAPVLVPRPEPIDEPRRHRVSDIHLYAHGSLGKGYAKAFSIEFTYPSTTTEKANTLTLKRVHLVDAVTEAMEQGASVRRPLIWLNCCNAAGEAGAQLLSLSADLARAGCNVIAPRGEVTEALAVYMASFFYSYLTSHPVPRDALLAARVGCLKDFNNPLGLLFMGVGSLL
jgi:hypothetical protein